MTVTTTRDHAPVSEIVVADTTRPMTEVESVRRSRQFGEAWMPEMPPVSRRLGKTDAELLKAGICPICGAGPYTSPAGHVSKAHGIDRFELREMVGLYRTDTICDPTHSAACRERSRARYERGEMSPLLVHAKGIKHTLSPKARELQKTKAAKVDRQALGATISANYAERTADRDEQIVAAVEAGERFSQVVARFGLGGTNVLKGILKRRGVAIDGRARYWADRRGTDAPSLRAGRERNAAKAAAERARIIEARDQGVSVYDLAAELGTSERALRGRMARWGIKFPDGRSDPRRRPQPPRPKAEPWYCTLPGCEARGLAKGLCGRHYQQAKKRAKDTGCSVEEAVEWVRMNMHADVSPAS